MEWDADIISPRLCLTGYADGAQLHRDGQLVNCWPSPLDAINWISQSWRELSLNPSERWRGYLSYDLGRCFEEIGQWADDVYRTPLFQFGMDGSAVAAPAAHEAKTGHLQSTFSKAQYIAAVEKCLDYIREGDVFQINLSQVFTVPCSTPAHEVFARLQANTPGRFAAYQRFNELELVSNSPELFLHVDSSGNVLTRPIKGTRPHGDGMESELLHSAKDRAELNMIVDLERNDLGRVCQVGSVRVTEARTIEAHPTVYHGVATIEGLLRPDVTLVDLLRATFPGGSVTGAPKIRAMQIIEELEPRRRGPYCGAIGCISADGSMMFNVAIRTMIFKDGLVHIPVGGGIVADSDPAAEYEETLVKARAMFDALGVRL